MGDELRVVEMGAHKLRFENDCEIGEWYEEKARVELRETPEVREEALAKLKEMIDIADICAFFLIMAKSHDWEEDNKKRETALIILHSVTVFLYTLNVVWISFTAAWIHDSSVSFDPSSENYCHHVCYRLLFSYTITIVAVCGSIIALVTVGFIALIVLHQLVIPIPRLFSPDHRDTIMKKPPPLKLPCDWLLTSSPLMVSVLTVSSFVFCLESESEVFFYQMPIRLWITASWNLICQLGREDMNREFLADEYLLGFLRVCKFYPQSAFDRLHYSFVFKKKYPKYYDNLNPLDERNVFANNIFTVLPSRDQHGRRIFLIEAGQRWNPKHVSLTEIVRGVFMIVEAALLEARTQICGASIIIDVNGLPMSHVFQFTPGFAKFLLDWVQDVVPARLKAVHIVNQPYIFNMVFNIFKPFIGEKLRRRIFFHGTDRASLTSHIEAKFLPTQYGGEMQLDTIYGENLHDVLCLYADRFAEVNGRKLIEVKKKGKK